MADIGGLTELRGFDPRFRVGRSSFSGRLEMRIPYDFLSHAPIPGLRSTHLQFVPWVDSARIFDGEGEEWNTSVGLGIQRFLGFFGRASNLRLDLAAPLGPDRSHDLRIALVFGPVF